MTIVGSWQWLTNRSWDHEGLEFLGGETTAVKGNAQKELEREKYPGFSLPPLAECIQMAGVKYSRKCSLLKYMTKQKAEWKMTGTLCEVGEHHTRLLSGPRSSCVQPSMEVCICIMSLLDCNYTSHVGFLHKTMSSTAELLSQFVPSTIFDI